MDLNKLGEKQISLSEWLEQIDFPKTEEFRKEDNAKRETLEQLNKIIGLPFDKCTQFPAEEIADRTINYNEFLNKHGEELCAYRLIPSESNLPKLRMRGHSIKETLNWFNDQTIDPKKYRVDICPHSDKYLWSTIFVVNKNGIFGEIIQGNPFLLTQGFYKETHPIAFSFDFENWQLSEENEKALEHLILIMQNIFVDDGLKQKEIEQKFNGRFFENYLSGYWETGYSEQFGLWFIDWNRILGDILDDYRVTSTNRSTNDTNTLNGIVAYPGRVRRRVKIALTPNPSLQVERGTREAGGEWSSERFILVCKMTTPEYLPLMKECAAIITEQGGILSHAAIVARELKKPCVVGVKGVLEKLKDGDEVEINEGEISKIQ